MACASVVAVDAINSGLYAAIILEVRNPGSCGLRRLFPPALLELPFPLAGPLPPWRTVFAWFGLVPLLWAILVAGLRGESPAAAARVSVAYFCGVLWYAGNCYWVRDTMLHYGDMPPLAPTLLLLGYSMVLGLYFGFFGLFVVMVRRATGSTRLALALRRFCGLRWSWLLRALPLFPGINWATRRWITRL